MKSVLHISHVNNYNYKMVVNTKHAWTNFNGLLNFVAHTDAGRELFKNPNSVYLFTTNKRERERERGTMKNGKIFFQQNRAYLCLG